MTNSPSPAATRKRAKETGTDENFPALAENIPDWWAEHNYDSKTFILPVRDPYFMMMEETASFLRAVELMSQAGHIVNVGVKGPKGAGKTSLAEWFAAATKRPLFVLDVQTMREPKDLLGYKDVVVEDGHQRLKWQISGFVKALQTPRACIVLDEVTRVHASVLNILLPLLDHRRKVYVDDLGERIEVAEGVVFFMTANVGIQYTGTWQMDAALEDRISYQMDVGYLPKAMEAEVIANKTGISPEIAMKLAEVGEIIRQRVCDDSANPLPHEVSTRQLICAGHLIKQKVNPLDSMLFTILPTYSTDGGTESDRTVVQTILQGKLADLEAA